jgi:uncharacterized protein YegJ (DUF2314 family)
MTGHALVRIVCLILLALTGCSRSGPKDNRAETTGDKVTAVSAEDPEMNAAIATARSKLPDFWRKLEHPAKNESDFCLKVRITDQNDTEHFWVSGVEKKDGKIYGTINNDPNSVKSVRLGQRIEVKEDQISDWLFMRNGKMVGNYTLRPLMKTMSEEDLAKAKAILEEP